MNDVENPMINFKEEEPKTVAYCCECNEALTEQDTFIDFEGDYVCNEDCLNAYMNIKYVEGWELGR